MRRAGGRLGFRGQCCHRAPRPPSPSLLLRLQLPWPGGRRVSSGMLSAWNALPCCVSALGPLTKYHKPGDLRQERSTPAQSGGQSLKPACGQDPLPPGARGRVLPASARSWGLQASLAVAAAPQPVPISTWPPLCVSVSSPLPMRTLAFGFTVTPVLVPRAPTVLSAFQAAELEGGDPEPASCVCHSHGQGLGTWPPGPQGARGEPGYQKPAWSLPQPPCSPHS